MPPPGLSRSLNVDYAQTDFSAGEVSPRVHGRFDSPIYPRALKECRNFMVLPQGPLRMRAGTIRVGEETSAPRLFPFTQAGAEEDIVLAITAGKTRAYDRTTGLLSFQQNLAMVGGESRFDSGIVGWTVTAGTITGVNGAAQFTVPVNEVATMERAFALEVGHTYTLRFRCRSVPATLGLFYMAVDGVNVIMTGLNGAWLELSHTFVAANASTVIRFHAAGAVIGLVEPDLYYLDDVVITENGSQLVTEVATPWAANQLAGLQQGSEPAANRCVFAHPNVSPHVMVIAQGVWDSYAYPYTGVPQFSGTNWPRAVEVGYQGRTWFGGTPAQPNQLWGSASGDPFNFAIPQTPAADDPASWVVSTKGAIRWMQGQKSLLMGSSRVEHSVTGSSGLIHGGDAQVADESAFGSADMQAVHIGDQVLFVTRDRRHVRALDYSQERNGWVSQALTTTAEHVTAGKVKELHFARAPDPIIFAVLEDGDLVACTYDRGAQVLGWWQIDVGGTVSSAAVADTANGSELWLAVTRGSRHFVERLPLHEVGVGYADCAITTDANRMCVWVFWNNVVPPSVAAGATFDATGGGSGHTAADVGRDVIFEAGGRIRITALVDFQRVTVEVIETLSPTTVQGLQYGQLLWTQQSWAVPVPHLTGEVVVVNDGANAGTQTVDAHGMVTLPPRTDASWTAARDRVTSVIGLPFTARAVTLPPEAGGPRGTSQRAKRRWVKGWMRLNDSALPLVNGRRLPDRTPSSPQDDEEPLRTGDCGIFSTDWGDGSLTIEQDLPLRTEILAVFGNLAQSEV